MVIKGNVHIKMWMCSPDCSDHLCILVT